MAQYKLKYFDITGLAEVSRYIFVYGGIEYEDVLVPFLFDLFVKKDEEYIREIKKGLPFGLLPTLEFDGRVVTQSQAIARYLAIKVGLYGNDPLESLLIDEAYGNIDDLRIKFSQVHYADPAVKPSLMADLKEQVIPYYLEKFEKIVGETDGHFAVPRWNLADFLFGSYIYYCNAIVSDDILKDYPNLQKLNADLEALPRLKDYIKNRPKNVL